MNTVIDQVFVQTRDTELNCNLYHNYKQVVDMAHAIFSADNVQPHRHQHDCDGTKLYKKVG